MIRRKVLFLCTGNSIRSQIAEAIVNARLGDSWEAFSVGTQPAAAVHPKAIAVLAEIGIRHEGRPKKPDVFRDVTFDPVVTLCDDAAENCLVWLGKGKRVHLGFSNPAAAAGTDDEIKAEFRKVREDLRNRLLPLLENNAD